MPRRSVARPLHRVSLGKRPSWIQDGPLTPAQRKGLLYEKRVHRELREVYTKCRHYEGPWIYWEDKWGPAVCQPDHVIIPNDTDLPVVVAEMKLTWRPECERKLKRLYGPLVSRLVNDRPVRLVQVCGGMPANCPADFPYALDELLHPDFTCRPSKGYPYAAVHWR